MFALDEAIIELNNALNEPTERFVRGIAEEAGEVVGAFNKWDDKRTDKPMTRNDILHEMSQLYGCILLVALHLGFNTADLYEKTLTFARDKAENIGEERYTHRGMDNA